MHIVSDHADGPSATQSFLSQGTHTIATLPGFLPEHHARQLLLQDIIVDAPKSLAELHCLWEKARKQAQNRPQQTNSTAITVKPLPQKWQGYEQELKSRQMYLRHYEGFADYHLWCVPIDQLITPQWCVDLDYVEALGTRVPQPDDWEGVLAFAFEEEAKWDAPLISAINDNAAAVTFRSPAQNLMFASPLLCPPEVRPLNALEYEVVLRVQVKPNYLQVARIRGHYVIINGNHHLLALWKAGWKSIPCLLREAHQFSELFAPNTLGVIPEVQALASPPYIYELLDQELAPRFQQRAIDQLLQLLVQSNTILAART